MERGVIRTLLQWLRPWHPVSGFLFGYVFGVVWCFVLLVSLEGWHVYRPHLVMPFVYGIFWAVLWGFSGLACHTFPAYWGTIATVLAIGYAHWELLTGGRLSPWAVMTIPVYTAVAILPCHWLLLLLAVIRGRVE